MINHVIEQLRNHQAELAKEYQVKRIGIFGSVARGDETAQSDVDILVEFSESISFFQLIELEWHLEQLLGRSVDLVTLEALKPRIKEQILADTRYV